MNVSEPPISSSHSRRVYAFGSSTPRYLTYLDHIPKRYRIYDAKVHSSRRSGDPTLADYMREARSASPSRKRDRSLDSTLHRRWAFGSSTPRALSHLDRLAPEFRVYDTRLLPINGDKRSKTITSFAQSSTGATKRYVRRTSSMNSVTGASAKKRAPTHTAHKPQPRSPSAPAAGHTPSSKSARKKPQQDISDTETKEETTQKRVDENTHVITQTTTVTKVITQQLPDNDQSPISTNQQQTIDQNTSDVLPPVVTIADHDQLERELTEEQQILMKDEPSPRADQNHNVQQETVVIEETEAENRTEPEEANQTVKETLTHTVVTETLLDTSSYVLDEKSAEVSESEEAALMQRPAEVIDSQTKEVEEAVVESSAEEDQRVPESRSPVRSEASSPSSIRHQDVDEPTTLQQELQAQETHKVPEDSGDSEESRTLVHIVEESRTVQQYEPLEPEQPMVTELIQPEQSEDVQMASIENSPREVIEKDEREPEFEELQSTPVTNEPTPNVPDIVHVEGSESARSRQSSSSSADKEIKEMVVEPVDVGDPLPLGDTAPEDHTVTITASKTSSTTSEEKRASESDFADDESYQRHVTQTVVTTSSQLMGGNIQSSVTETVRTIERHVVKESEELEHELEPMLGEERSRSSSEASVERAKTQLTDAESVPADADTARSTDNSHKQSDRGSESDTF